MTRHPRKWVPIYGARSGSRTHKAFRTKDFKSFAYTIPPPGQYNAEAWAGISLLASPKGGCALKPCGFNISTTGKHLFSRPLSGFNPQPVLRPGRELNPRIRVLQTLALPLGYQALPLHKVRLTIIYFYLSNLSIL